MRLTLRCLAIASLSLVATTAESATWNVHEDGSGDAPTIQAAIDLAAPGDEILVHPGTYHERLVASKGLSVIGVAGPDLTVIQGSLFESVFSIIIEEGTDAFVLRGLHIQGAGSDENVGWPYPALYQSSLNLVVEDCRLESFSVMRATMRNCQIVGTESNGNDAVDSLVEDCVFAELDDTWGASGLTVWGSTTVRGCTFDRCNGFAQVPVVGYGDGSTPIVEDNLFVDCSGPCIAPALIPPVAARAAPNTGAIGFLVVRGNTFVRNVHGPLGPWPGDEFAPFVPGTFERNVVTESEFGVWLPPGLSYALTCNDSWGNGSNWTGFPDPSGVNGNFSSPPLFCDPLQNNFSVSANSPLLAPNNECGVQIGAFGMGCGTIGVEAASWAEIKSRFRR